MFATAPLFGRFHSSFKKIISSLRQQPLHHLESLCADRIAPALLALNDTERERIFTPKLTFLTFLDQVLNPGSSCRNALDQIKTYYQSQPAPPPIDSNTSGYCQARARWTTAELVDIRCHLAQRLAIHGDTLLAELPVSRPLKVIDGTTFNLPDTAANREVCPQSEDQLPGCGFPLVRLVGVFCLKTGALLEEASAPHTTSENALFHDLWPTFQADDILLADGNFSSYGSLAGLRQQSVDSLFELHASRKRDFRQGRRLGPRDRLITWAKPKVKPANLTQEQWQQLPATLTVRLVRVRLATQNGRCKYLTLVTTLTDPKAWPVRLLAALYARRWKIELYWDDIKTTLQMDMLSCRTPAMVHKELQMHFIAYNLVRSLMGEAALLAHAPLDRISFKGTLDAAHHYSLAMDKIPVRHRHRRRMLFLEMLSTIASDLVPERPDRREPRCQKRRPKAYPFMTRPRHLMNDLPKDSRRKKHRYS
jgi:hypothetical protein